MGICWGSPPNAKLTHASSSQSYDTKSAPGNAKQKNPLTPSNQQIVSGNRKNATIVVKCDPSISSNLKSFTFNDLKNATKNFRSDSLLGEGGFGYVFKGWIDENTYTPSKPGSGMVVAVKKLKTESFQGHREWLAEVNYLGQFHHENLVKLIGFCSESENKLLVYEFMSRGSLENHLFRSHLTPKSDVYSFGVVLLELLSGKRAMGDENAGPAEETLVDWARPFLRDSRRVTRIMDTRLGGQYSKKGAQAAASLALRCIRTDPKHRPLMQQVLTILEQVHSPKDIPRTRQHAKPETILNGNYSQKTVRGFAGEK